jgi:putative FmdB family regulatory protein
MKRMYEFACDCGQRTEALVDYETASVQCGCGGQAQRIISAPAFNLEGWSGHFPTAAAQFGRRHTEKLAAERKANS